MKRSTLIIMVLTAFAFYYSLKGLVKFQCKHFKSKTYKWMLLFMKEYFCNTRFNQITLKTHPLRFTSDPQHLSERHNAFKIVKKIIKELFTDVTLDWIMMTHFSNSSVSKQKPFRGRANYHITVATGSQHFWEIQTQSLKEEENIYHPTKEKVPVARFTVKITTCK